MYDWLAELTRGQRVLDLASGAGSYPYSQFPFSSVALDEDLDAFRTAAKLPPGPYYRVLGRSESLPFREGAFDLVVCHHGLEHVAEVPGTLREIRRVLKPDGRLYVSVPHGYGLCDRVYRAVFDGGGHVQRFRRETLVAQVEELAGLRLLRWQKLYSSFVYLRRLQEMFQASPPPGLAPRLRVIGRLPGPLIASAQLLLHAGTRVLDRFLHTDSSVYGWALYFSPGEGTAIEAPGYVNVCMFCGTGLPASDAPQRRILRYRCPSCNRTNLYFRPFGNAV